MTGIRNGLAVLIAVAIFLFAGHTLAPLMTPHLPGRDALSAVVGLLAALTPIVYKLLVELMAAGRFGGKPPVRSQVVSIVAGAGVLALVSGAFTFLATYGLEEAAEIFKGVPAGQSLVRTGVLHLNILKLGTEMVAALIVGSWVGRRHGREAIVPVVGFALLGWLLALSVDVISGVRSAPAVHNAFMNLPASMSKGMSGIVPAAHELALPLLIGALIAGVIGCLASGGRRGSGAPSALVLGAD